MIAPAAPASSWRSTPYRLKHRIISLGRRGAAAAAFAAGLATNLAMAPFFVTPVLFLTLPVLLWSAERSARCSRRPWLAGFWPGWWFGFGYFLIGLFWIGEAFLVDAERVLWLLPFAVTLLPAGLAIFFGLATSATTLAVGAGAPRVVALALALSASEWLRGHILTGFPWNIIGYALTNPLPLMQAAAYVGIYGLTLAAVLLFTGPLTILADAEPAAGRKPIMTAAAFAVVPLALMAAFGGLRLSMLADATVADVKLRIVQPSVPQREKWRPDLQRQIFFDHIDLSRRDPTGIDDGMAQVSHVIWPEAAMPFRPLQSPEALAALGDMLPAGKVLISGGLRTATRPDGGIDARNSLIAFDADGAPVSVYDKIHLVPFGEYLPVRGLLERIGLRALAEQRGGFGIGVTPRPNLEIPGLPPVGPLICYEAIFPAAVVQTGVRPQVLINLTNDGWFGNTTGPRQHFHQSRVRAVEEGLPLVRAANNGISAVVAPSGRVTARLDLNVRGTLDAALPQALPPTLYGRTGDYIFGIAWTALAVVCGIICRRRRGFLRDKGIFS